MTKTQVLFICSRNEWRSLTAEKLFAKHPNYAVRSAGTSNNARIKVTLGMIGWADIIFCMEKKHRDKLTQAFGEALENKRVIVLNIPDDYVFMDETLIEILQQRVAEHIDI